MMYTMISSLDFDKVENTYFLILKKYYKQKKFNLDTKGLMSETYNIIYRKVI